MARGDGLSGGTFDPDPAPAPAGTGARPGAGMEILARGPARGGLRRSTTVAIMWVVVAGLLLAATGAGVRWWDGRVRADAAAGIERTYRAAAASVLEGEQQVRAMLDYAGPLRTSPAAPPELRADLTELVRATAQTALVRVEEARADLVGIGALPWQDDVATARDAALAWLDERSRGLRETAATGEPAFADLATVDDLRDRLRLAMTVLAAPALD